MRKLLTAFFALSILLGTAGVVLAYSNAYTDLQAEKSLLVDGDMEASGTTSWTAYNSAVLTKNSTNVKSGKQVIRIAWNATSYPYAGQTILSTGKTYRVTGWARGDGTAKPSIGNQTDRWTGTISTSWQRVDFNFTQNLTNTFYLRAFTTVAGYAEFDDVFVTEYRGGTKDNEKQLVADGDMEASGVTSWTNYNNAVPTKTTDGNKSGRQALRVTYAGSSSSGYVRNANNLTVGKTFRVTGWARSDGTLVPRVLTQTNVFWIGTNSTSWQRVDGVATITQAGVLLGSQVAGTAVNYIEFDDIFATEYVGRTNDIEKQLLADGDMEKTGTTDWQPFHVTISKQTTGQKTGKRSIRVAVVDGVIPIAYQLVLTPDARYRVTGWARSDGSGSVPRIACGSSGVFVFTGTSSATWQRVDGVCTAGGTSPSPLRLTEQALTGYVEFDDIFVTALP